MQLWKQLAGDQVMCNAQERGMQCWAGAGMFFSISCKRIGWRHEGVIRRVSVQSFQAKLQRAWPGEAPSGVTSVFEFEVTAATSRNSHKQELFVPVSWGALAATVRICDPWCIQWHLFKISTHTRAHTQFLTHACTHTDVYTYYIHITYTLLTYQARSSGPASPIGLARPSRQVLSFAQSATTFFLLALALSCLALSYCLNLEGKVMCEHCQALQAFQDRMQWL